MKTVLRNFVERHFHAGRGGRAKLAMSASLMARIVGMLVSLVNVPLSVRYLGNEGYGLLTVVISVIGWIQLSNLGLGLGLQNALTEQVALGNKKAQCELVSTTFFALLGISILLLIAAAIAFPLISWTRMFPPTSDRFVTQIPWLVGLAMICFVCTTAWGFVQPIYAARQELHLYYISGMIANVAGLVVLVLGIHFKAGVLGVAFANIGMTTVFLVVFGLWTLFGRGLPELRPRWSAVTRQSWTAIHQTGLGFLVMQISSIVIFQCDAFIISRFLPVEQVTPYAVGQRVFAQLIGVVGIAAGALWPAFGNAKALGDVAWLRKIYRKVTWSFLLIYGAAFLGLSLLGHQLLALWAGAAAAPSALLIMAIGVNYFLIQWSANHSLMLGGLGIVRKQAVMMMVHAVLGVGLNIFFVQRLGSMGMAVGSTLAQLAISAWYLPWLFHRTIRSLPTTPAPSPAPVAA